MNGQTGVDDQKSPFRWAVLSILFLNVFIVFLGVQCIPPLFKEIGAESPYQGPDWVDHGNTYTAVHYFFSSLRSHYRQDRVKMDLRDGYYPHCTGRCSTGVRR